MEVQRESDQFQFFNEKAIDTANLMLKSVLLINGGAAVALLGFAASIVKENNQVASILIGTSEALLWFAYGVVAAVVALGFSYVTHYATLYQISCDDMGKSERLSAWCKGVAHIIALISAVASVIYFVLGAVQVKYTIANEQVISTILSAE